MNLKLSDLIILSDVDGTLLRTGSPIHPENIRALERFVAKGGRFAISTGRGKSFTQPLVEQLPVNFPCVIFNGGMLYDFEKEEILYEVDLPQGAVDYIKEMMAQYPACAAVAVTKESYLDIDGSATRFYGDVYPNKSMRAATLEEAGSSLMKSLMLLQPEWTPDFFEYVEKRKFPGVRFVAASAHMIEMLPENSSKGNAILRLMELTGVRREQLVAIGDYYNDKEMLQEAGIGVTMHNAPEELKALAKLFVCECKDGSLADLVAQLESLYP